MLFITAEIQMYLKDNVGINGLIVEIILQTGFNFYNVCVVPLQKSPISLKRFQLMLYWGESVVQVHLSLEIFEDWRQLPQKG